MTKCIIYGQITAAGIYFCYNARKLEFLVLPKTLTNIAGNNDNFSRTDKLTTVICNQTTPPTLSNNRLFSSAGNSQVIYVPDDSLIAYQSATYWSSYTSRLRTFTQLKAEHPEWYDLYVEKE